MQVARRHVAPFFNVEDAISSKQSWQATKKDVFYSRNLEDLNPWGGGGGKRRCVEQRKCLNLILLTYFLLSYFLFHFFYTLSLGQSQYNSIIYMWILENVICKKMWEGPRPSPNATRMHVRYLRWIHLPTNNLKLIIFMTIF